MQKLTARRDRSPVEDAPFTLLISVDARQSSPTQSLIVAYRCVGEHPGDNLKFDDGPSRNALEAERDACLALLNAAASRPWAHFAQPMPDRRTHQRRGYELFDLLFRHSDDVRHIRNRGRLERWLASPNLRSITVTCTLASFPFEALYLKSHADGVDVEGFLGLRAPMMHLPERGADLPDEMEGDVPSIGFLGHNGVPAVARRDDESVFAMLNEIAGCRVVEATPLKDKNNVIMSVADMPALFRAFAKRRSVWHVTSHMSNPGGVHEFTLDNDLPISARDLDARRPAVSFLVGQPLVFLSICDSGTPGALAANDVAASFNALDAGGVIATRSVVNGNFATRLAGRFYKNAFGESSVAESLFKTRTESIQIDKNLAALTYFFEATRDFSLPTAAMHQETSASKAMHG